MKFFQNWTGIAIDEIGNEFEFPVNVPGNLQYDYAVAKNWGDMNDGINCVRYIQLEGYTWQYVSNFKVEANTDERVFFVSNGIDYKYSISINDNELLKSEGMFSKVEVDITDYIKEENTLIVTIFPHPKREGAQINSSREADSIAKAPVCYGWDWHPRLLISGLWQETYIETRKNDYINDFSYKYKISEDYTSATLNFDIDCNSEAVVEIFDKADNLIYKGNGKNITINDLKLWWCNGHGEPYLYKYVISTQSDVRKGKIGFRNIELILTRAACSYHKYPMSRNYAPICIELNGKQIFGKGTNFVAPEIFIGNITYDRYNELLHMVKDCNMNMVRMWGGCGVQKECFYDICDELGIMVWQEFPLACNNYGVFDKENYLEVLEKEATYIIKMLKKHVSLFMWCGGNELFNNWSKMTDQSAPVRLLDALCYRLNPEIPYIMTAPLNGMKHGPYQFSDEAYEDIIQLFQQTQATAYTEFGVKSVAPPDYLRTFLTEEDLNDRKPKKNSPWIYHYGISSIASPDDEVYGYMLDKFKMKKETIDDVYESSMWMQCEGLKGVYEEARRQWPFCSMAANWMFNEPWKVACGWSLVLYPNIKKDAFYSVRDALRPTLVSARIPKFAWQPNELFSAEIWLLNDSYKKVSDVVDVYLIINDKKHLLATWQFDGKDSNLLGPVVNFNLPDVEAEYFLLKIEARNNSELNSEYKVRYIAKEQTVAPHSYIDIDATVDFFM